MQQLHFCEKDMAEEKIQNVAALYPRQQISRISYEVAPVDFNILSA